MFERDLMELSDSAQNLDLLVSVIFQIYNKENQIRSKFNSNGVKADTIQTLLK